jgi:hypothetical protein
MRKVLIVSTCLVTLCTVAKAEEKPVGTFGWLAVGKAIPMEEGHIYWVGEFSGTFTSDKAKGPFDGSGWKCPGTNDINMTKNTSTAQGACVVAEPGGNDRAFVTWKCHGEAALCNGTWDWVGGTGKYKELSGNNTFVGHTLVDWKDGTLSGYSAINK